MRFASDLSPAALATYFGPFVHGLLLAQVSTRVAAEQTLALLTHELTTIEPEPAALATRLVARARSRATELAHDEANRVESADESAAGTEARRQLSLLRAMPAESRELLVLRLVENIGADELSEVLGLPLEQVKTQLVAALADAASRLAIDDGLAGSEAYLLDSQTAPAPVVVRLENGFEPLRYNEDYGREKPAPAPVAPAMTLDEEQPFVGLTVAHVPPSPLLMPRPSMSADAAPALGVTDTQPAHQPAARTDVQPAFQPARSDERERVTDPHPPRAPAVDDRERETVIKPPRSSSPFDAPSPAGDWRSRVPSDDEPQPPPPAAAPHNPWRARALPLGVGFAAVTAVLGFTAVRSIERRAELVHPTVPVLVAKRDLPVGRRLELNDLATREMPEVFAGSSAAHPEQLNLALTQPLTMPLQAGDPLLWSHLGASRRVERLSRHIGRRLRAYALPVDQLSSFHGLLRPDDRVDLIITLQANAKTVLEDVPVLAVGLVSARTIAFPDGRQPEYAEIALGMLEEEAELVALANENAGTHLTLRRPGDEEVDAQRSRLVARDLLDANRAPGLAQKREATVQKIRESPRPNR